MAGIGARLAQPEEACQECDGGDGRGKHEQRTPAVAVLDQHPHLLPRQRITHQVTDAEDAENGTVRGVVEPFRGDLDQARPADRLREAISHPGKREQRQRAGEPKQQREGRGAAHADQEVAPSPPVVAEPGQNELAERIREYTQRGDGPELHQRLAVTQAPPAELVRQQGVAIDRSARAVVAGRIAGKQQHDRADSRGAQ